MEPLSLEQISVALEKKNKPVQFYQYNELPDDPDQLSKLLLSIPSSFLFFNANKNSDTGHWTAMRRLGSHIWWFSSYGFLPDGEMILCDDMKEVPGQEHLKISKALEYLQNEKDYTIHYSSVPLQQVGDGSVSCGIWCLLFLTSYIKDFEKFEDRLAQITNPEQYAQAIYRYEILGEERPPKENFNKKSSKDDKKPFSSRLAKARPYEASQVHHGVSGGKSQWGKDKSPRTG